MAATLCNMGRFRSKRCTKILTFTVGIFCFVLGTVGYANLLERKVIFTEKSTHEFLNIPYKADQHQNNISNLLPVRTVLIDTYRFHGIFTDTLFVKE